LIYRDQTEDLWNEFEKLFIRFKSVCDDWSIEEQLFLLLENVFDIVNYHMSKLVLILFAFIVRVVKGEWCFATCIWCVIGVYLHQN
jgi:hypothetical protein